MTTKELLLKCYALSLSDQYWVKPAHKDLRWEDINFFQNEFSEDIGKILFGDVGDADGISLSSPDNTSDGWLKKKWVIADGKRVLLKGGSSPGYQEPYNEVLASRIMDRLQIPHVPYKVIKQDGRALSACEDFITTDTDLVAAWRIYECGKRQNHESNYQYFLRICDELGIPGVQDALEKMIVVDFIMVNTDRHYNNFGALRHAETLEWLGMAPIFDTGTSMWHSDFDERIDARDYRLKAKPFKPKQKEQIKLVRSLDWFDPALLQGIDEEYAELLKDNEYVTPRRRDILCKALRERVQMVRESFASDASDEGSL
jgi:hypothetical protein